jgi:hypothetical protein
VNWFGKLLNRVTGWDRVVSDRRVVFTGRTAAGVYVDADNALKNATVWACVQYLTRTVGQLPWHAYLRDDKGNATVASTHRVDYLLNVRPNPEMGSFTFRQLMLGHVLLRGNAYAEIQRDNRGLPVALWPLHPDRVCARRRDDGALYYEVWNSGAIPRSRRWTCIMSAAWRRAGGVQRHRLRGAVDRLGAGDGGVRLDLLRQRHEPERRGDERRGLTPAGLDELRRN